MSDSRKYWAPVCLLVTKLKCWTRVGVDDGASRWVGPWGMLLTIPVDGYLESSGGPVPIRHIEWVELSSEKPAGGRAGIPLEFRKVSDLIPSIEPLGLTWENRETSWAVDGIFDERPVQVVHLPNPFWVRS